MKEFIPRFCPICNDPKNEIDDGVEFILRCRCDWERGYYERLNKTVHTEFWQNKKRLVDWSPPIFKGGGGAEFKNLISLQKALAVAKLYDFYYKESTTSKTPAIFKSIDYGRNLFIRGPLNSGRGLLLASIKTFAAIKEISTTPLPCEWSVLKTELVESDQFGSQGEITKIKVSGKYRDVKIMVIENIKGEGSKYDDRTTKRFRGAMALDELLAWRLSNKGSMVLTSYDFSGQIKDSLGDILPEVLDSDKTSCIFLFDAREADDLLKGLHRRAEKLMSDLSSYMLTKAPNEHGVKKEGTFGIRRDSDKEIESFKNLWFFNEAFSQIPSMNTEAKHSTVIKTVWKVIEDIEANPSNIKMIATIEDFEKDKNKKNLTYFENLHSAYEGAVEESSLSKKFSSREKLEIGKMISLACRDIGEINTDIKTAIEIRKVMSGETV